MKYYVLLALFVSGIICASCQDDVASSLQEDSFSEEPSTRVEGEGSGTNLVKNADIETPFSAQATPRIAGPEITDGTKTLDFVNCWYASSRAPGSKLEVVSDMGGNRSSHSLRYSAANVFSSEAVDLSYPFKNVAAGKYTLSFQAKSDSLSSFVTSIVICQNESDVATDANKQKAITFLRSGEQAIKAGDRRIWATMISDFSLDWRTYKVTVDIPQNVLVKIVIKPCAGANRDYEDYSSDRKTNIRFWFDNFSFTNVITLAGDDYDNNVDLIKQMCEEEKNN